jgi:uncharacterized protein YdaU (DUF1376 family)
MSQNRTAPAYQEYAASILAQLQFRTMSLQDRGLLYTMRLECWVNERLPINPGDLAKVLGVSVSEVSGSMAAVMPFFKIIDGYVISPELEAYRAHLADRKAKQSQGGKIGSAITNRKHHSSDKTAKNCSSSNQPSISRLTCRDSRVSLVQRNTEKQNQTQSIEKGLDRFVAEYEAAESCSPDEYALASSSRQIGKRVTQP